MKDFFFLFYHVFRTPSNNPIACSAYFLELNRVKRNSLGIRRRVTTIVSVKEFSVFRFTRILNKFSDTDCGMQAFAYKLISTM